MTRGATTTRSSRPTRRTFLAAAGATALLPGTRVRGANDDIRVAVIGVRSKGWQHAKMFQDLPGVRVVALCDADRTVLADRASKMTTSVRQYVDMREVFDADDIDAVVIATPNHWHALATIWACQSGKDVYVEKPVSHTIWESQQMIAAARKYDRIVQAGTQRRSDRKLMSTLASLRNGKLGAIKRVRVLHYSFRNSIGSGPIQPPESVNYNLWAGPAEMVTPLGRDRFHYDWHWRWDTGNGELGNNGPHGLDLARYCIGQDQLPPRVLSIAGRYVWNDGGETPNTHITLLDYQPVPILVEMRNLPTKTGVRTSDVYMGQRVGLVVECEDGYFGGFQGGALYDYNHKRIEAISGDGGRHHQRNFIDAVRSRKVSDLTCDIREGHLSSALCHLGNLSHRMGEPTAPGEIRRRVSDDATADAFERFAEHLAANGVDLAQHRPVLGAPLAIDPSTERFTGPDADRANALLSRPYRHPFVVPEVS